MIYIKSRFTDAADNFALEYWAAQQHFADLVFMLWSTRPTVMLGKYQDAWTETNLAYVERHGLAVTRRLSGGGTIFTDPGSFQYTFIKPSPKQTIDFEEFLAIISQALRKLGVPVERSSRNDLTVHQRKFSGNAQYNHHGYVVHHGSLLFDTNINEMAAALHVDSVKLKAKKISSVHQRVLNLQQLLPEMSQQEFANGLTAAVLQQAPAIQEYQLTAADRVAVAKIKEQLFANPDFVYGSAPEAAMTKERYFAGGGLVKVALTIKQGKLTQVHITGDFFSNLDARAMETALIGLDFRTGVLRPVLAAWLWQYPIRQITTDQLLDVFFA